MRKFRPVKSYPSENFSSSQSYRVIRVIDGDTILIRYGYKNERVRLIGINAPEKISEMTPVDTGGGFATTILENLLSGEYVYLRLDRVKRDKYKRLLAYVYRAPDGLFVNLELIRQGYAYAFTRYPFKHIQLFRHYAYQARRNEKGIYSVPDAETVNLEFGETNDSELR